MYFSYDKQKAISRLRIVNCYLGSFICINHINGLSGNKKFIKHYLKRLIKY